MGPTNGRSDGLMRAKGLAVGKVHIVVDFRDVEPHLPDMCLLRRGLPEAVRLPNMDICSPE
jgi:hypothetical protein